MSQFGMQMPGAQRARKAKMNVYTVLLLGAVIALLAANALTYLNATKISPKDAGMLAPLTIHEDGKVKIPS